MNHPIAFCFWQTAALFCMPVAAWSQTPPEPPAAPASEAAVPVETGVPNLCRPLSDKAMAVDLKTAAAQSQKRDLTEQLLLATEAAALWTQAVAACEGRTQARAQRNLGDTQKTLAHLQEQQNAGPLCETTQKDASTLQDLARQTLTERRFGEAAVMFRKAENMWDLAAEQCSGSQQEQAVRRRDQSETDGHNAEFCAPPFEKAREQTQKLRSNAAGMAREEKHEASLVAETLWRDTLGQCKGSVLDTVRNNIQALARERGTPWVATRSGPAVAQQAAPSTAAKPPAPAPAKTALVGTNPAVPSTVAALPQPAPSVPPTLAAEFEVNGTRFSGQFVRDSETDMGPAGVTLSGTGTLQWPNGDRYEGSLVKGKRHGKGRFTWPSGQSYLGDWVHDQADGQANLRFANGDVYDGQVRAGSPEGQGSMRYASGDSFRGLFRAGMPGGSGAYTWKNGQVFEGQWGNGQPHGEGHMVFVGGAQYQGQFVHGKSEGQGSFTWPNGDEYTGQWQAGLKSGQGVFIWASGERWEGIFENDKPKR